MQTIGEGRACPRPQTFHILSKDGPRIPHLSYTTHDLTTPVTSGVEQGHPHPFWQHLLLGGRGTEAWSDRADV